METPSWVKHFDNGPITRPISTYNGKDDGPVAGPSGTRTLDRSIVGPKAGSGNNIQTVYGTLDRKTGNGNGLSNSNGYRTLDRNGGAGNSGPTEHTWTIGPSENNRQRNSISAYESYSDLDRASTSSQYIPRIRTVQSSPACNLAEEEKKTKKRRRRKPAEETSGYSTTSLSELSECESPRRKSSANIISNKRRESIQDDRSDKSRQSRLSHVTSKSEISKGQSNRKVSDTSRGSTSTRESMGHLQRPLSAMSIAESVHSDGSNQTNKSRQSRQTNRTTVSQSPHKGSRLSLNTENSVDPFYFIQPVPESFSSKVRKSLGPIFGIIVMIILAASLGAAIYFAVELKKTHEDEIEMLRANLNLKISNARFSEDVNLDDLSQSDFNSMSLKYCQQMDRFYRRSENFKNTYRGCEVLSIRSGNINFTLFFVDKGQRATKGEKATQRDIISVIETSAPKVEESGKSIALVDKFEIELENVKIKIEHKRELATFNKIIEKETPLPPITKPRPVTMAPIIVSTTRMETTKGQTSVTPSTVSSTTTVVKTTSTVKTTTTAQNSIDQIKSLRAWDPCSQLEGTFFQHPTECNQYFQCEHKKSLLQNCTGNLVFDSTSNVCVQHRPGIVCPDPSAAPPKPLPTTTIEPTTVGTTTKASSESTKTKSTIPNYPSRPVYPREPCATGQVGSLYPHPDDCAKFIQCITGGTGVIYTCAGELVYDPEQKTCVYRRNELVCPDIMPCKNQERGYYPHPFNCSLYIQCQAGSELVQQCASGLVWDPSVNSCMFRTVSSICPEDFG